MFLSLVLAFRGSGLAVDDIGGADGPAGELGRWFSADVRQLQHQREGLERELAALPQSGTTPTSARLGWHTKVLHSSGETVWVQVDLGRRLPLDTIALVPANGAAQDAGGAGYGFPLRFRIEVSDDEAFAQREVVADQTAADVANPRDLPLVVPAAGRTARFVRVTMTKPWPRREDWVVALGELMVLSVGRNVAAGRPVKASNSLESPPVWEAANLTDGQSLLGPPVAREPSPSNGFLAVQEARADLVKWVQIDLGRAVPIEAVRLFPSRPQDFADTPGNGFPVRFRVEAATDAAFVDAVKLFETGEQDFVNPGDNPVTIPANGQRARFVRMTATRLYNRGEANSFALAEMQVWSGGANVAIGAATTAFDRFDEARFPRWQPEFLVDGFNSKNRILTDAEWLAGLARRADLFQELAALDRQRGLATDAALAFLIKTGVGTVGGVLLLAGVLVWRARVARQRAVEDLRRRIASDLHDEIGSNLGSIALLAEAARREGGDAHAAEDFAAIESVASRTHESLREIVWFISPGVVTRAELVARMRESAPTLLGSIAWEFCAPPSLREGACPLEFARNVWLTFKETLHNVARHSGAAHVTIRVAEPDGGFELEVRDNGHGFIESEVEPGNGLLNLRRRATDLRGTLRITSEPGRGTTVQLTIPRV